ncbi:MAG: PIN domain nuclease [Acidimicrobiia bacterium]|nr:PIN domain nuclease [Acidimicrobiia bacterium]
MILIDSSAWIDFLRDAPGVTANAVEAALDGEATICDVISMEVLAGARDDAQEVSRRGLLARATVIPTEPTDYDLAAVLYRTCRRRGETVRKLIDCLIASVAIKSGLQLLHSDRDFNALARHTPLEIHPSSTP